MSTRKIIDPKQNGEKVWLKGHAKAIYMSDGSTVEDVINSIDIPSLDDYVTETELNDKGFLTEHQNISHLATKVEVSESIADIDFYDIQNNPVVNTEEGKLLFVDETGNIGLQIEGDVLYVKDVVAGNNALTEKQDVLVSGTNIKTINGQSILGSGNITIEGGTGNSDANVQAVDEISTIIDVDMDKYIVETTDDNIILDNNKYYKKTNVSSNINISLNIPDDNTVFTSFAIEFTTSDSGTSVSLPNTIKWLNGELPIFENNFTYQISIMNNLGVCAKYA